MHIRRSSWQLTAVSLTAAFSIAAVTIGQAIAASPRVHSGKAAHSSSKLYKQLHCKTKTKAKGTIKWSDWQFPDTLNPYQTSASVSTETIDSLLEGLVLFDQNGKPQPDIYATLPKPDKSGKVYTATLKKGLLWSNGKEITSADVKFGWHIGMDKNSGPFCSGSCDAISRIDTKGKYGIVYHLKQVYAPFVTNGEPPVWPVEWPGAWAKGDVAAAVNKLFQDQAFNFEGPGFPTNGAYQVAQFVQNDRIVLHPMGKYHVLSCGAPTQTLIFVFYSSKPGMIAAAASHQTDSSTDYSLADLKTLNQHTDAFRVHSDPGYLIEHLIFNHDATYNGKPNPLHNVKVRQALALALDKYGLIQSALGLTKKQADSIIAWTPLILTKALVQPFADRTLKGQWDPIAKAYTATTGRGKALADAKKLLSQAGFAGGGFSLDGYTTSGNPVRAAQYAVVQASWKAIGVDFVPNFIPAGKFFSDWDHGSPLKHGAFQVAMFADVGYPDPDGFKYEFQHQYVDREATVHVSTNANDAGIHDPVYDQAFNKAAGSTDPKVRQHWYSVWQTHLNQQADWINLFYRGSINTDDGHIGNYLSNPTNEGEEWNTWQWIPRAHA